MEQGGDEEEVLPTLKLKLEQGPRAGETLEFKPIPGGPNIQVGRIIRGNTISIKDPGISTHHLSIHFTTTHHSAPDPKPISKWVITDLNSSNGTVMNNDVALSPMVPTDLRDGDTIKIGEITSIKVKIGGETDGNNNTNNNRAVRRNPRRRGAGDDTVGCVAEDKRYRGGKKANFGSIGENIELGFGGVELGENKNVGRGGRGRKARVLRNEAQEREIKVEILEETKNVVGLVEEAKRGGRQVRSRGRPKKIIEVESENLEEMENVGSIEEAKRRGRQGRTRGGLKKKGVENSEVGAELGNVMRSTQSSKKMEESMSLNVYGSSCRELGNFGLNEGGEKKGGRGGRWKRNLRDDTTTVSNKNNGVVMGEEDVEELNLGQKKDDNEAKKFVLNDSLLEGVGADGLEHRKNTGLNVQEEGCENDGNEAEHLLNEGLEGVPVNGLEDKGVGGLNLGEEGCQKLETASRVEESSFRGGEVPDLEKMTLGEWFDYLEVYLPKQIHEETEELILGMKQRAEQFHKFILQQKNAKEKG